MLKHEMSCNEEIHSLILDDDGILTMSHHDPNEEETADIFGEDTSSCYTVFRYLVKDPTFVVLSSIITNKINLLEIALEMGGDPNQPEGRPLIAASSIGNTKAIELLIKYGAAVSAKYDAALRKATSRNRVEAARLLLDAGANISAVTSFTKDNRARANHHEMLKLLLDRGLDVQDVEESLLLIGAEYGHKQIVKHLLASRQFPADEVKIAIAAAEERDREGRPRREILQMLEEYA